MKRILALLLLFVPLRTFAQDDADMSAFQYHSDFRYTLADIDSLLVRSPQFVLLAERIKNRNRQDSFLRSLSFHLTYSPFDEVVPEPRKIWIGVNIPVGKIFLCNAELDSAELMAAMVALKLQARELWKQREEMLEELGLEIQKYKTAEIKLQKAQVSLSVRQASEDDVLETQDSLAGLLTQIRKKKLDIKLTEDRLKALIGKL